jgi:hypothetical protein
MNKDWKGSGTSLDVNAVKGDHLFMMRSGFLYRKSAVAIMTTL